MLLDRNDGRLAKTIRLLDSPVAGERAAALEAACRQLETLGLSWADVAPKFATLVSDRGDGAAHGRAMAAEKLLLTTCRWGGCSGLPLRGSPFCEAHVAEIISEPSGNFMPFLRNLPAAVGAAIAGDALYHAIHAAVHIGMFNRHLRHDLIRATSASRDGNGIEATTEKLVAAIGPPEQGEFLMHLKRQLVVPERRFVRREATD